MIHLVISPLFMHLLVDLSLLIAHIYFCLYLCLMFILSIVCSLVHLMLAPAPKQTPCTFCSLANQGILIVNEGALAEDGSQNE